MTQRNLALFPTSRGTTSKLYWLHENGLLENIHRALLEWSVKEGCREIRERPQLVLEKCRHYRGATEISELILASAAEVFGDEEKSYFDSDYFARELLTLRSLPQLPFDYEIFLCNSSFDYQMRYKYRPLMIALYNFCRPLVNPIDHVYQIKRVIRDYLQASEIPLDLNDARVHLKRHDFLVGEAFIASLVLNDPDFLFVKGRVSRFDLSEKVFSSWKLARDLIPDSEYVSSSGMTWGESNDFHQVRFEVKPKMLKAFFSHHNDDANLALIDSRELCLKLRSAHRAFSEKKVQGVPPAVHGFIVSWIRKNKKVWQTRNSAKFLGRNFYFKPEIIPPNSGSLVAYGHQRRNNNRVSSALATLEMVAKDRQTKGLIHPQRILTPATDETPELTKVDFERLLAQSACHYKWQLIDTDALAAAWLKQNRVDPKPFTLISVSKMIESRIEDRFFFLGKNLWLEDSYKELFEGLSFSERREELFDLIKPRNIDARSFLESVTREESETLRKLL